jgi:hypothetical protein
MFIRPQKECIDLGSMYQTRSAAILMSVAAA